MVHGSAGSVEQNRFLGVQYRLEGCRGVFPYYGYVRLKAAVLQRPGWFSILPYEALFSPLSSVKLYYKEYGRLLKIGVVTIG